MNRYYVLRNVDTLSLNRKHYKEQVRLSIHYFCWILVSKFIGFLDFFYCFFFLFGFIGLLDFLKTCVVSSEIQTHNHR